MNIFALLSLLSALSCFFLASLIFYLDRKKAPNRIYALFCGLSGIWAFSEFMYRQAGDVRTAYLWEKVNFCRILIPTLLLHFSFLYAGKKGNKKIAWFYFGGAVVALLHLTTDLINSAPALMPWGYTYGIPENPAIFWLSIIFGFIQIFAALFIILRALLKKKDTGEIRLGRFILTGISVPVIFGLAEAISPLLTVRIPEMTAISFGVMCVIIGYGIKKYELFSIDRLSAAEGIFNLVSDYVLLVGPEGKVINANPSFLLFFGYDREEIIGRNVEQYFLSGSGPEDLPGFGTKNIDFIETEILNNKNAGIPVLLTCSLVEDRWGKITGKIYIARDISEIRSRETEIKRLNSLLLAIRNVNQAIVQENNLSRLFLKSCEILCEIRGYADVYIAAYDHRNGNLFKGHKGRHNDFLKENDLVSLTGLPPCLARIFEPGQKTLICDYKGLCRDCPAEKQDQEHSTILIPFKENGETFGFLKVCFNSGVVEVHSDEIKLLEEVAGDLEYAFMKIIQEIALVESEKKYLDLLDNTNDLIVTVNPEGRFLYYNKAFRKILGYDDTEISGLTICDLVKSSEKKHCLDIFDRMSKGEEPRLMNTVLLKKNGLPIFVEGNATCRFSNGRFLYARIIFRDITEKMLVENERAKAEKLESISLLAGGIAHDYNNLLAGILGNITYLKQNCGAENEDSDAIRDIETAAIRAKELSNQLLTFAKGGEPVKEILSVDKALKEASDLCLHGSKISCEFDFHPGLHPVNADKGQLAQVFNNLIINARQAMHEGGTINISAENIIIRQTPGIPVSPGGYVKITIRDSGPGIPKESIDKIFDPYFTTKKTGSGLGLSITYSVLRRHNGYILAESEEGRGAAFTIYLPSSDEAVICPEKTKEEKPGVLEGKARKILVLDDEKFIFNLVRKILNKHGFITEHARTGEEAVQMYRRAFSGNKKYSLVILDLTIPGGMGGRETMPKLLKIDPQAAGLVSSGYSSDPVITEYKKYGFRGFLVKPFTMEELLAKLKKIIEEGNRDGSY